MGRLGASGRGHPGCAHLVHSSAFQAPGRTISRGAVTTEPSHTAPGRWLDPEQSFSFKTPFPARCPNVRTPACADTLWL